MYINKALVYGNLTRDPELRSLPSGMNIATFSIATNRVFRDREGKKQEQADFHNIVVFGRQADLAAQYLKKGRTAFIEGRIQTRSWEKDGEKKYRTEIVAERVQFGPGGPGAPAGGVRGGARTRAEESGAPAANNANGIEYPQEDINPDDIPF